MKKTVDSAWQSIMYPCCARTHERRLEIRLGGSILSKSWILHDLNRSCRHTGVRDGAQKKFNFHQGNAFG